MGTYRRSVVKGQHGSVMGCVMVCMYGGPERLLLSHEVVCLWSLRSMAVHRRVGYEIAQGESMSWEWRSLTEGRGGELLWLITCEALTARS
jgi:hypothetical protein